MQIHLAYFIDNLNEGGGVQANCITTVRNLADRGYIVDLILLRFEGQWLTRIPENVNLVVIDDKFPERKKIWKCSKNSNELNWIRPPSGITENIGALIQYLCAVGRPYRFRLNFKIRHLRWARMMTHYIDEAKPDVIFACLFHPQMVSLISTRTASQRVPVICSVRNAMGFEESANHLAYLNRYMVHASRIHTVSQEVADSVAQYVPAVKKKIVPIENPTFKPEIVTLQREPVEHEWLKAKDYSQSGNPVKTILAVGRLAPQKNFPMLIRAVAEVLTVRNVRLIILGEGSQRKEIEQLVDDLSIGHAISMPGHTENPYAFMARSDLFVLSSSWEGFPNVIVEAMACGCPIVSTDCPAGPREILEYGRWGSLVPVNDPNLLAEAIIKSLDADSDAHDLKQRAMEYSPGRYLNKFERLVQQVVSESKSHSSRAWPGTAF